MKAILKKYLLYFLILVYISGTIGFVLKPAFFLPFTPYTLLLTVCVFIIYQLPVKTNYFLVFFTLAILSFILEVFGVKTGSIFGAYFYGSTLGYKLFEVPLIISLNWVMIVALAVLSSSMFFKNKFAIVFFAASLTTLTDLLIEQVAGQLDFWHFSNNLAGIHNYIGWFVISLFFSWVLYGQVISGNKKVALLLLILQLFFFGIIYLFNTFKFC